MENTNCFPKPLFDSKTTVKQYFSLPYFITRYIKNNSTSLKNYLNLIQTCKYFTSPKEFLPIKAITFANGIWEVCRYVTPSEGRIRVNELELFSNKIWLTDSLTIRLYSPAIVIKNIFQNVFRCDVRHLRVCYQTMTFNEFKFLTLSGNVTVFEFRKTAVVTNNKDNKMVLLETLFENLPNVVDFSYSLNETMLSMISTKTADAIIEKANPTKLKRFNLSGVHSIFDFNAFLIFMKRFPQIFFDLHYIGHFTDEQIAKCQAFVDEIIGALLPPVDKPKNISFPGQNNDKRAYLVMLCMMFSHP